MKFKVLLYADLVVITRVQLELDLWTAHTFTTQT